MKNLRSVGNPRVVYEKFSVTRAKLRSLDVVLSARVSIPGTQKRAIAKWTFLRDPSLLSKRALVTCDAGPFRADILGPTRATARFMTVHA